MFFRLCYARFRVPPALRRGAHWVPAPPNAQRLRAKARPRPTGGLRHSGSGLKAAIVCRLPRGCGYAGWVLAYGLPPRRRACRAAGSFVACVPPNTPPPRSPSSPAPAFPQPRYRIRSVFQKFLNKLEPFFASATVFQFIKKIFKIRIVCNLGTATMPTAWAITIRLGGLGIGWLSPPMREATVALKRTWLIVESYLGLFLLSLCFSHEARIYPPPTR